MLNFKMLIVLVFSLLILSRKISIQTRDPFLYNEDEYVLSPEDANATELETT